jgi:hypothetical protein
MARNNIFPSSPPREWEDDFMEHNLTAIHPQFNDEDTLPVFSSGPVPSLVPRNTNITDAAFQHEMQAQIREDYPLSCNTDSTATIVAEKAGSTATIAASPQQVRKHILFHTNRDYNSPGGVQPLTEGAIAAFDHDGTGSYNGNIAAWVRGGRQSSPEDVVSVNMSLLRSPRTRTTTRTGSTLGSSWSMVSMATPSVSQVDYIAESICAAGLQFNDVPAGPTGPDLLDEDIV